MTIFIFYSCFESACTMGGQLLKFDDGNAGLTLTKCSKTITLDIFALAQFFVDSFSQSACAATVDDGDIRYVGQISIIEIFVQIDHGFINGFTDQIDGSIDMGRFIHLDLAGAGLIDHRCVDDFFVNWLQITEVNTGFENAHLDRQFPFAVWLGDNGAF